MSLQNYLPYTEDIATRIIYELLGRRWVWPAITTTEEIDVPPGQRFLHLSGRPVRDVISIVDSNDPDTQLDFVLHNGYRVDFGTDPTAIVGGYWYPLPYATMCNATTKIIVEYTYGSPPPLAVKMAIDMLSREFTLLFNGDDECKLPERVKSVSRQGISMEILSPQDFLENGLTGVTEIDEILATFNPSKAKRPARVVSQVLPPPRRRNTTQAD